MYINCFRLPRNTSRTANCNTRRLAGVGTIGSAQTTSFRDSSRDPRLLFELISNAFVNAMERVIIKFSDSVKHLDK